MVQANQEDQEDGHQWVVDDEVLPGLEAEQEAVWEAECQLQEAAQEVVLEAHVVLVVEEQEDLEKVEHLNVLLIQLVH